MTSLRTHAARVGRRAALGAIALAALAPAAGAQRAGTPKGAARGFDLFAVVDFAATGVRANGNPYRFFVTNSGPMDLQGTIVQGLSPATVSRGGTFRSQFPEVTLFATAAPGDRLRNVGDIPSLSNVSGGGAAFSYNFHKNAGLQTSDWYAADGSLGFSHSGAKQSSTGGCLNHGPSLTAAVYLMAGSDCPQTWGLRGWEGSSPITANAWLTVFNANRAGFRFNYFDVPRALQDTNNFLGDRFQTYGTITDYSRERVPAFGNVMPGGNGAPGEQGYPLGLEWKFDAFTMADAPGVVFWQATVTNKSDSLYGNGGIDYDSLYLGVIARQGRRLRGHAGFDPSRGAAFFNEVGNDDATNAGGCDGALPVPGSFASDAFFGDCREPLGFAEAAGAIVFLKSPIGDLRYKLFSDPTSRFAFAGSPVAGDTITYNIARMCGDECITDRMAVSPTAGFGVVAAREALALNGEQPSQLSPLQYWMLFHPANGSATDPSRRVDLANPRAGGGFNFTPLPGWQYEGRPGGRVTGGQDTLFYDTCNPTLDPATTPIAVPRTRAEFGRCTGRWVDTLPDRTLNFTRNATWLGAGPFRLAAGQKTALFIAIVTAADSATIERNVDGAIGLYQSFFVAPTPPPAPRITSVSIAGGNIRQTSVRLYWENRTIGYVDPFVTALAERFRVDTNPTTPLGKLNRLNPRIIVPGIGSTAGVPLRIADVLDTLARRQIAGFHIYKSCNPGSGEYTISTSPTLCTIDRITNAAGRDSAPAPYTSTLLSDTTYTYSDGNIISGRTYQYTVVPVTRGVRLTLVTDSTSAGGVPVRVVKDTVLVASRTDLPALFTAPNVATVYVPVSVQAGGTRSLVRYVSERGFQTFEGDSLAYAGPFVTITDSVPEQLDFRLVFGDSVRLREFQTNLGVDSTYVVVYRSEAIGFGFTGATTDPISRYATANRRFLDSLVFRRIEPIAVSRSIVGNSGPPVAPTAPDSARLRNDSTVIDLGNGRREVRHTLKFTGGVRVATDQIITGTNATVDRLLPQGVLLLRRGNEDIPVIVGNDFRNTTFGLNSRILGSADFRDVLVNVNNRPLIRAFTAASHGGLQVVERFWTDPVGGRFASAAVQAAVPTLDLQPTITRFVGTTAGELQFRFLGPDYGPREVFNLRDGIAAVQEQLDRSLAARPVGSQTSTDSVVANRIAAAGIPVTGADSLIPVKLPFDIRDLARDRASGGRQVIAAIRASDKFYAPSTLPAGGIGAVANRWYRLGSGLDTARVTVPLDQWVPGEPLILLERIPVADTTNTGAVRVENGQVVYRDSLVVIASRVTLGCATTFPAWCNPVEGRGGTGYSPTQQGYRLAVRLGIPLTSDREVRFTVTPTVSGTRVRAVSASQLDSVRVVPNPYVLFSAYEQSRANEQRIMFTHLPPEGIIRIYTATGQFVQQITWTPPDLSGNGDLYFNLLTREGTLMASGLYVFTVESRGSAGNARRKQVGRFIIIR